MKTILSSVIINEYTINYLDIGKGEPIVLVHGGVGDYRTWEAQIEAFSKDYRVIALSRRYAYPNKQEANETNDYSVSQHSQDLSQFLKTIDVGPVHLIGHSYGAFTCLITTLEHPALVKSLTLGEPPAMSFLQYVPNGEKLGNDLMMNTFIPAVQAFKNNYTEKAVEIFIGGVLNDPLYFSKANKEQKDLMMDNAFGLKGVLSSENPFPPLSCDDLEKFKTPTLLIKGDRSPEFLTAITDELAKCINNSELKLLSNSSHGLEYENPEEFNKIVLEFISKH
jgi:pimeloyl-ACP methyl ester carboxylesterase